MDKHAAVAYTILRWGYLEVKLFDKLTEILNDIVEFSFLDDMKYK